MRAKNTPEILSLRKEIEDLSKAATPDRQALTGKQRQLAAVEAVNMEIILRDLAAGKEQRLDDDGLLKAGIAFSADGREVYLAGGKESDTAASEIYALSETAKPRALTSGPGFKTNPIAVPGASTSSTPSLLSRHFPAPGQHSRAHLAETGRSAIRSPRRRREEAGRREAAGSLHCSISPAALRPGSPDRRSPSAANGSALVFLADGGSRKQHPGDKAERPAHAGHHQEVSRANRIRSTIS